MTDFSPAERTRHMSARPRYIVIAEMENPMPVTLVRPTMAATMMALFAYFPLAAQAEIKKVEPTDKALIDANPVANIYFFGSVNQTKIKDLLSAIDEINIRHGNIKKIHLYINSGGGNMDNGFAAYWAVKSSYIPITTVNLTLVGSAATLLFCASENRYAMKGARFLLHPASLGGYAVNDYRPNDIIRIQKDLQISNKFFSDIYKECTNFKAEEIDSFLSSEDSKKVMFEEEAKSRGISKGTTDKIAPASLVYYVTDDPSAK